MKELLIRLVISVIIRALSYGSWKIKRWVNYSMGYENAVTKTVCKMIKPKYLLNPEKCN